MRHTKNFEWSQIKNADQSPIFWDMSMVTSTEEKDTEYIATKMH